MAPASRMSAKDLAGPVAIFLGALLLVAAIALPLYFTGTLKKTPMDLDITSVATSQPQPGVSGTEAQPAKIFNSCSVNEPRAEVSDARLTQQQRVIVVDPSDSNIATFQAGNSIRIDSYSSDGESVTPTAEGGEGACMTSLLTATRDLVTTDRKTAEPQISGGGQSEIKVDASDNSVSLPDRTGLQYRFPFGVEKSDEYQYFDLTTRTTNPLTYVDDSTEIGGVKALHFTQEVPEVDLSTLSDANDQQLAGTSLDQTAAWYGGFPGYRGNDKLPASLVQSSTRDLYVDPASGTILNEQQHIRQSYKLNVSEDSPPEMLEYRLTALDVVFSYDQDTQEQLASDAKSLSDPITLWGRWIPIVIGILGLILLAVGIWLLLRSDARPGPAAAGPDSPSDRDDRPGSHPQPREQQGHEQQDHEQPGYGQQDYGQPYDPDQTRQIPVIRDEDDGFANWSPPRT